jgi:CheY-like chemotaxis protein
MRDHIFEKFTQADASTTRRYGGTGLGLAICRELTEMMGGAIGVDANGNAGSTFWCTFELPAAEQQPGGNPALTGRTVLLTSGGVLERKALGELLRSEGATVREGAIAGARPGEIVVVESGAESAVPGDCTGIVLADPGQRTTASLPVITRPVRRNELLAAMAGQARAPGASSNGRTSPADARKGTRVLLVEDTVVNQKVATSMLHRFGCEVDLAQNGREAVERTAVAKYALILMDCQMPEMDGFEATRRIREREAGGAARTPIVAMTAHAMQGDRERCLAAGMDDYLSKPVRRDALEGVLARWIESGEPGPAAPLTGVVAGAVIDGEVIRGLREMESSGQNGLFADVIRLFAEQGRMLLEELRDGVVSGNRSRVADRLHALKGTAGSVGARELAAYCLRFEYVAASLDTDSGLAMLQELADVFDRARVALTQELVPDA